MKTKHVTLYQIYDQEGNKKLKPFREYKDAEYMLNHFLYIYGKIEEIEMPITEFLNKGNII